MNTDEYIKMIAPIAEKYLEEKQKSSKIGFNAFKLASDFYYRENFHSDILCEILNPQGSHKEGDRFLKIFIECINKTISQGEKIDIKNYKDAEVVREAKKIDILIKSEQSKHCIIIENKLNNAEDKYRQLPRYCCAMHKIDYTIDRIIYIPLDSFKEPNQLGWENEDSKKIDSLLTIIPASAPNEEKLDLKSWLLECKEKAWYIRSRSVIDQYIELINFLANDFMMSDIIKDFHKTLLDDPQNKKCVEAIIKMSNEELPYFMAKRLYEEFDYNMRIDPHPDCAVFVIDNFLQNKTSLTFDIRCLGLKGYEVILWDSTGENIENIFRDDICEILNGKILENKKWIKSTFDFDQEEDVIKKVKQVINYLNKIKD
ncbi:MAG: PD-(D/E)XK nuclease family protein [Paludibacteraceae bacterium]|nr:PD-(D/E)XK nuclease family protein [Paludibacteraceae bacterium]